MPKISVILETTSIDEGNDIEIAECLRALAAQTYPTEDMELIVIDGGNVSNLDQVVQGFFPSARFLRLPGASKFEMKNLGIGHARGEIIAFVDGDCAPEAHWLQRIAEALDGAPAQAAGVQGVTSFKGGLFAAEISALFYGVRHTGDGRSARLVTDNCAFRRAMIKERAFEHVNFSKVIDSLFLRRLEHDGKFMIVRDDLRMYHSYPRGAGRVSKFVLTRAYDVGYYMVKARKLEPVLRGAALVRRWGGAGWMLLCAGKLWLDFRQVWGARRVLPVRMWLATPLTLAFETVVFVGGMVALYGRESNPR